MNHCLSLLAKGDASLGGCAEWVREMLAVCRALETLVVSESRPLQAAAALCANVCDDCRVEGEKHAHHHEECKACMEACVKGPEVAPRRLRRFGRRGDEAVARCVRRAAHLTSVGVGRTSWDQAVQDVEMRFPARGRVGTDGNATRARRDDGCRFAFVRRTWRASSRTASSASPR